MNIYISSDHGGFDLKKQVLEQFKDQLVDLGPTELIEDDDYPDYAFALAQKVASDSESLGILICRSGNGMVIAANKVKGAYAALCFTEKHAQMAKEDDNANILALDADYEDAQTHFKIIKAFLNSKFAGIDTRHGRRFSKIKNFEDANL